MHVITRRRTDILTILVAGRGGRHAWVDIVMADLVVMAAESTKLEELRSRNGTSGLHSLREAVPRRLRLSSTS